MIILMKLRKIIQFLIRELGLFVIGGSIYVIIEMLARGFSHWTMFIVGGLCFTIIGLLNEWYSWNMLFELQTLVGAFVITALEFISGYIINIQLGLNVWDYSDRLFNLYGQICLHHSIFYWIPLSCIAILLDDWIRYKLFDEEKPRYRCILTK